jgi:hypothetical protein
LPAARLPDGQVATIRGVGGRAVHQQPITNLFAFNSKQRYDKAPLSAPESRG